MFLNKEHLILEGSFEVKDMNMRLRVEEWGDNTVRVTASPKHSFDYKESVHGMEELEKNPPSTVLISQTDSTIELKNNKLKVVYDGDKLSFYNANALILTEYSRVPSQVRRTIGVDDHIPIKDEPTSSLNVTPYDFSYVDDGSYETQARFEGDAEEKIYGLGGYQEKHLNKNLGTYELMQRNSQTSIPFYLSNKNYGFVWNNASVGTATFSRNKKVWTSNNTDCVDYIITVADDPKGVINNYTAMTGRAPMVNSDVLGLWQSKLRYQTTEEVEEIYNGYKRRNIDLSVLVIDYFHWTDDGDFEFDYNYWSNIDKLSQRLKDNGTRLMVSLWPTVTESSKYYSYYKNNQLLIKSINSEEKIFDGKDILDFSNPLTKKTLKNLLDKNYKSLEIDMFWADQAEPEMDNYRHANYALFQGKLDKVGNKYPYHYVKAISTKDEGSQTTSALPILIRSAWFNSQKHGALAWSGDIESSFESLQRQIQISISMGVAGAPWWTSDIAGFHSGDSESASFKELMVRWFQFATFSPILRMHGDRQPHTQRIGDSGGGKRTSGGPNEIWSFGEEVENILIRFINIREKLKDYILSVYEESHEKGYPIIRPLFLEYPDDPNAWEETSTFMLGEDLLVSPVVKEGMTEMPVYLPKGSKWVNVFTKETYDGGEMHKIKVTLDTLPVFYRQSDQLKQSLKNII